MSFKEHNNREVSKKLAEYITGTELRKYVAGKVKKYLNIENPTVFDGAVGSGQLEQFVNPAILYGVDVQENSINSARENFKNTELEIKSFFENIKKEKIYKNIEGFELKDIIKRNLIKYNMMLYLKKAVEKDKENKE